MKTKTIRRVTVPFLAAGLLAGALTAPAAAGDRPELRQNLQEWIDAGFTGIQLRVRDEKGEWAGSAGMRELGASAKPPTNGSFWTGSVTKTVVATVVLQLVAENRVTLDSPVADHLPEYGLDRRITVRMLLQHTSGLFNYTGDLGPDGTWMPGITASGDAWVTERFRSYTPQELVRVALSKPPRFEPGAGQEYSNTNFTLAQLLIEKITGRPYADELRDRILRPLGMRDTMVPGDRTRLPGPHAHGYYRVQGKVVDVSRQNLSLLTGAGDLITTTKDQATFMSALNGGRLLPAPLLDEMRKPYGKLGYGLGLFVQDLGPGCGTVYQHNGSPPHGYGALMYSSPDGRKTLTASVTWVDESPARGAAQHFDRLLKSLLTQVYCEAR